MKGKCAREANLLSEQVKTHLHEKKNHSTRHQNQPTMGNNNSMTKEEQWRDQREKAEVRHEDLSYPGSGAIKHYHVEIDKYDNSLVSTNQREPYKRSMKYFRAKNGHHFVKERINNNKGYVRVVKGAPTKKSYALAELDAYILKRRQDMELM